MYTIYYEAEMNELVVNRASLNDELGIAYWLRIEMDTGLYSAHLMAKTKDQLVIEFFIDLESKGDELGMNEQNKSESM
jgi:hypothetical protein